MQILELPEFRDLTFRLPDCYRIRQGHGYRLAIGLIGEAEIWPMASILRLMTVTVGLATSSKSRGDGGAPVLA